MKKTKKILMISCGVLLIIAVLVIVNFIPVFSLETGNMKKLDGNWINVYYENEESAAIDVFGYADAETGALAEKLGFSEKKDINVYIYDSQSTMQKKKYGFIALMLGLDWYIGDNIGTNVILTSPANPGKVHNYNNNKYAVTHEIVHAYISVINPDIHLWLTEGTALYLTNGAPFSGEFLQVIGIPSFSDINTRSPIRFEKCGGYTYTTTYIEYLDITYGWDSVLELLKTENYEECFGKSQKDIYGEWVNYITNYQA